jgi:hypothetical protein
MGFAYDAARSQVVLFGGHALHKDLNDTWIWGGSGWTQLAPSHSPPPRDYPGMAYDVARGQVVLFGGDNGSDYLDDTWTWDGTDWTQRTPAHSPTARTALGMAYDAAHGRVVLFGGVRYPGDLADTWTWDGTDWTQQSPAHSPTARQDMGMAYDAAGGQVVLFGGGFYTDGDGLDDTWTWDGTDWTQRAPAHSPPAREDMGMAYDAARSEVVLFSGNGPDYLDDTWTWDGTDWAQRAPAHSPLSRWGAGMAYDAARAEVVLFGGDGALDTWAWDGTDWSLSTQGSIELTPHSGPPGTAVTVRASGFASYEGIKLTLIDPAQGVLVSKVWFVDERGAFRTKITIPLDAGVGRKIVKAKAFTSGQVVKRPFRVT